MKLVQVVNCLQAVKAGDPPEPDGNSSVAAWKQRLAENFGPVSADSFAVYGRTGRDNFCLQLFDILKNLKLYASRFDELCLQVEKAAKSHRGSLAKVAAPFYSSIGVWAVHFSELVKALITEVDRKSRNDKEEKRWESGGRLKCGAWLEYLEDAREGLEEALAVRKAWLNANKDSFKSYDHAERMRMQMCTFSYIPGSIVVAKYKTSAITKLLRERAPAHWEDYCNVHGNSEAADCADTEQSIAISTMGKDACVNDIFMLISAALWRAMLSAADPEAGESDGAALLLAFRMPAFEQWLSDLHKHTGGDLSHLMLTPEEYAELERIIQKRGSESRDTSDILLAAKMFFSQAAFRVCSLRPPVSKTRSDTSQKKTVRSPEEIYWIRARGCIDGLQYALLTGKVKISTKNMLFLARFFSIVFNVRLDILLIQNLVITTQVVASPLPPRRCPARLYSDTVRYFVQRPEGCIAKDEKEYRLMCDLPVSRLFVNYWGAVSKRIRGYNLNRYGYLKLYDDRSYCLRTMLELSGVGIHDHDHHDAIRAIKEFKKSDVREPHFTLWRKNGRWCCTTAASLLAH
ncbi:hypothetical protein PAPHI01_1837 [Pancytospora philotis]|nr:hypothetical protein PAPHI01_1837 [Pancytospora philotis]